VLAHHDEHVPSRSSGDGAAFMDVIYNCAEEPFDDPAVRYALGFAYNRQAVVDIAFFGEGSPITGGFIQEGIFGHNPDLEGTFDYDPDRAQELLAEAGYPDGFSCTLMSTSQYGMHQGTAEVVQENLQDIGVDCELQLFDWSTVVERWEQAEYQFRIHGRGTGEGDPDVLSLIYHSTRPAALRSNCSYPEVDELLDRAREIVDPDEREPLYYEVQELLLELSITSLLTTRVQSETVRNNVHGYEHYPGGLFSTSCQSIEKVWIEDE
jgi:ABC-type transport system substrate-binding protein